MNLLLLLGLLGGFQEKPAQAPAKPAADPPLALVGAEVHTVTQGVLKGATILIRDGKIDRVGHDLELPEGTVRHDLAGMVVIPGLVAVTTRGLGLLPGGSPKLADLVDPYQENIVLALAAGITTAFVTSGPGGFFEARIEGVSGSNAALKMAYGDLEGMLLAEPTSVSIPWVGAPAVQRQQVRESFDKAREALDKLKEFETRKAAGRTGPNDKPPTVPSSPHVQLLRGETVARFTARSAAEIASVLDLVNEYGFRAVLMDAQEAWTLADEIGRARATCVITPRRKHPRNELSTRPSGSSIEAAAILHKAGVRFAIAPLAEVIDTGGIGGRDLQNLLLEAAFAVRGGLDEGTALAAVTLHAAEILGVQNRVGSIEPGKDADFAVLDGPPLDYRSLVERTYVSGKLLYERAKSPYFEHLKKSR